MYKLPVRDGILVCFFAVFCCSFRFFYCRTLYTFHEITLNRVGTLRTLCVHEDEHLPIQYPISARADKLKVQEKRYKTTNYAHHKPLGSG